MLKILDWYLPWFVDLSYLLVRNIEIGIDLPASSTVRYHRTR